MFNFKKKNKWIRFYSLDTGVAALHPLFPAKKLRRKWRSEALKREHAKEEKKCPALKAKVLWQRLQDMDSTGAPDGLWSHAATCPALDGVMDTGYIIPAPADFIIHIDGSGNFEWRSETLFYGGRYLTAHIPDQTEGMRNLVNQQKDVLDYTIKMELPWRVQAHKDIVFIQQNIAYWDEERFSVPNGIVDPLYSYEINLQLFWHMTEPGDYMVKACTPLVQWLTVHRDILASKGVDVVIETANADDIDNNDIMEYNRRKNFTENTTLSGRIKTQSDLLKLNKNIERFN